MLPSTGCAPTPLSMLTSLALLVVQARVVESPSLIEVRLAVKLSMLTGSGAGLTVTVTCAVTGPLLPCAVRV